MSEKTPDPHSHKDTEETALALQRSRATLQPRPGSPSNISEDIRAVNEKMAKYVELQTKIRLVIKGGDEKHRQRNDEIIEDVVDAILQLGDSPTYVKILTLGLGLIPKHFKRKKLKSVIENILEKVFDASQLYSVDYEDLKWTCDFIGGQDYFSRKDHRAIYVAIIQKLKAGPLRDECLKNGLVDYVDEKLVDIYANFHKFRTEEL